MAQGKGWTFNIIFYYLFRWRIIKFYDDFRSEYFITFLQNQPQGPFLVSKAQYLLAAPK